MSDTNKKQVEVSLNGLTAYLAEYVEDEADNNNFIMQKNISANLADWFKQGIEAYQSVGECVVKVCFEDDTDLRNCLAAYIKDKTRLFGNGKSERSKVVIEVLQNIKYMLDQH